MIDVSGRPLCLGLFELYKYGEGLPTRRKRRFLRITGALYAWLLLIIARWVGWLG